MSFTNLTKLNEVNATDSEIFTQFSRVFTFSTNESGFKLTLDLIQSGVNSLKTTWILSRISSPEGKVQVGNSQSRSPLLNILFSC